jgi:hypothetical protein
MSKCELGEQRQALLPDLQVALRQVRKDKHRWAGVVVPSCSPSTQEAEAGGLKVGGQPVLLREMLLKKQKQKHKKEKTHVIPCE